MVASDIAVAAITAGATLAGGAATAALAGWMERRHRREQLIDERTERIRQRVVDVVTTARNILDIDMIAGTEDARKAKRPTLEAALGSLLASAVDLASLEPALGKIAEDARFALFIDQLLEEHAKRTA